MKKEIKRSDLIKKELKKVASIDAITGTPGGEILFNSLMADAVSCVDTLCVKYSELTHTEFIALCAEMKVNLDLARVMKKSKKNTMEAKRDLEEALLEEKTDEDE